MFYSKYYNLLFIASPKTGTRSVEKYLLEIDPEGEKWKVPLNNRIVTSVDLPSKSIGHARACELKNAIGPDEFDKLNSFGFVRHPFDKLVSSYFFNKNLSLTAAFSKKGKKNRLITILGGLINVLAAKILPFKLWALLFPLKTNREYFVDRKGKLIVKYLGRTKFLNTDLKKILLQFGVETENIDIPHINKTPHRNYREYFKNDFFRKLMGKKYKKDIEFYNNAVKPIEQLYVKDFTWQQYEMY